ncbi:hypothetical protein ACJMK2_019967 [Sinanodonta woodiana]|uniref:Uncharacterized protein n=1 Tax=Sinanodonta woodiana TaxID=1069815 RepID=A0ABD3TYH9_SINWO
MKTISVIVDGRNYYQKVTKTHKNNTDSYFLFMSNNIIEQELPKKIKVLKVAEDFASGTNRFNFILRKKIRPHVHEMSAITRRLLRKKSSAKELKVEKVEPMPYTPVRVPKQFRGVKHLYDIVPVPKRHLIESDEKLIKQVFHEHIKTDINLDQFPENFNDENMNGLRSFCDTVTTKMMENLPSAWPRPSFVDRSITDDHMTLMTCKFDRKCVDHANETLDGKLNTIMNAICHSKMVLYDEDDDHVRFATRSLAQRVTNTGQKRTRRNVKPVHSNPLVNKTMTYLNRSRNRLLTRQFGTSQLPFNKLANLQLQEIQRRDSYLSRRADGCNYFCENRYVSEFDENLDNIRLDKELDKTFDSINCSKYSAFSSNILSGNIQLNDRYHFVLPLDSSSRAILISVQTLKVKLVDYSLSDSDISSVAS